MRERVNYCDLVTSVKLALEFELKASAAGYPGCHPDNVTYTRIEMLKEGPNFEFTHFEFITFLCKEYHITMFK